MTLHERLVLQHLSQFVSEGKKQFVDNVLALRTRQVTVVLEDIYQSQNASAVIRTCECMGLQDIHVIEQKSKYDLNRRVLKGADKWVNLYRYHDRTANNTEACFNALREKEYQILVTDPAEDGVSIHDIDIKENKIAMVFGNELHGVSAFSLDNADKKIRIPMFGFTESLNISVSVAICLNVLITKLHQANTDLFLSDEEKEQIKLHWYRKIVRRSDLIEREFLRTI